MLDTWLTRQNMTLCRVKDESKPLVTTCLLATCVKTNSLSKEVPVHVRLWVWWGAFGENL